MRLFACKLQIQTPSSTNINLIIIIVISVVTVMEIESDKISHYFSHGNRRLHLSRPGTERTQTLTEVMQNAKQGMLSPDLYSAS